MSDATPPADPIDVIDRYCAAWSDQDPDRRAALLAQVWAEEATYTDPTVHAASAAELLDHIARVLARRPGARVVRTSAVDAHHGVARFAWQMILADGTTLPEGLDIAELSPDGRRIRRIVGFFGPIGKL